LQRAIELFNEAIGLDPSYALAYAGMSDAYSLLPQYADAPFEESMTRAKAAALRAIKLDNSLAEPHVSLAFVKQSQWEWDEVESDYKRGLALNPNYATAHQWYSEYLLPVGRLEEEQKEIRRA
jgi:Tfp pilus assembly protein PilF